MKSKHLLAAALLLLPTLVLAQTLPMVTSTPGSAGGTVYSLPVQTLATLTALSFIPAAVLMMTSFTRIVIVLSLLRQALGTQTSPPNQVIVGLSLFLTFFVMSPTLDKVYQDAYLPLSTGQIQFDEAITRASVPMKSFMLKQVRDPDLALFVKLARYEGARNAEDLPLRIIVPAFVTSELKTAFQIGFMIFIPFLIIDMVVASVLMSMGMMMLSPVLVSLPFKIMLFVVVDGWTLLMGTLASSFHQ